LIPFNTLLTVSRIAYVDRNSQQDVVRVFVCLAKRDESKSFEFPLDFDPGRVEGSKGPRCITSQDSEIRGAGCRIFRKVDQEDAL
jgi:hypothetical protein